MCGIAGVYNLEGIPDVGDLSKKLIRAMDHRGPNAAGKFSDDSVLLTHARLSILDLDSRSDQPFTSADGRWTLCFNGEIYNYREVRNTIVDYNFSTESDTEVLLAAWITWGEACLEKLNGMFAFALWDHQCKELFLVRDRLGIKPLYIFSGDDHVVFASEIRTVLASGLVPRKLNRTVLSEYLKYQTVHAPRTFIEDVYMLPPGSLVKIQEADIEEKVWWNLSGIHGQAVTTVKNAREKIAELLTSAVEKRLVSDVPLGAFLSGGIDSSLLVGIASERLNKKLDTFSITFPEREYSEAPYSRMIAKRFQTQHHEIELSATKFLEDIPSALSSMDHPSGDGPNSYVVSKAVKQAGLTVALSGLGGDELFAGYPFFTRFSKLQNKKFLLSFPRYMRWPLAKLVESRKPGIAGEKIAETILQPYFDIPHIYPINRRVLADKNIQGILGRISQDNLESDLANMFDHHVNGRYGYLSQVSIAEISTYMQNVLLRDTDQMSMAHALEVRVPFLDHDLVEYALRINDKVKYPVFAKSLLVDSFHGLLPDEVVHRPKMGFVLPWEMWLKNELKDTVLESFGILENLDIVAPGSLTSLYDRFLSGDKTLSWSRIWPLVSLGSWIKANNIE